MSEWKCGKCEKIYTFDEFLKLKKVKAVESDTNPSKEHGFTGVCDCGYRFLIDRWRLHDDVEIKTDKGSIDARVSTVDLELNHGFEEGEKIWYESKVFPGGLGDDGDGKLEWLKCYYENRYETREEAIKDHDRIVNLLREGKYKIEDLKDNKKELVILEEK